ncbi:formin-like protein 1 isoform X3 [Betta splendens]|uniref:Formin-like protein 1 isoform X3 n=1 Tax=Betta splendens TaxID=158456 RepID=A0A9W2XFD1_BETSP|nr:formin-like protein 1 isoform X3 [Betta splendens]
MGNAAGSMELPNPREARSGPAPALPTGPQKPAAVPKLPMPGEEELEERFSALLNTMNLPPDKVKILGQYDNEKKWDLICDQERFQVKNPPAAYLEKLRTCLDQGGVSRKFKRRVQECTQVLRELEISLRTNHIGWAEEFLNEDNQGLNVLVDYLSFANVAVASDVDNVDNGLVHTNKGKNTEKSVEDLSRSASNSPSHKALTVRFNSLQHRKAQRNSRVVSQKDDVHLCIMCLRAIMNYQSGFNLVMKHPSCVNEIALSLNNRNPRTKALVLELLAAVCLVRGGHDIILSAFDNFKEVCGEKSRFEKLMEFFCNDDNNIDFMVACMQFINIVVHSVENMNFRVYLQYEFTQHGLDDYLEKLKFTESDKLSVQIQAYLDNLFDVGALLEDAETKNALLEHMEELQEHNTQLSSRLQESEREAMEKVTELEKNLIQATKEVALLQESLRESSSQVTLLQQRERDIEVERESERARLRDQERCTQSLRELEVKVQALVQQGLVRMERSPCGRLDLLLLPVNPSAAQKRQVDRGIKAEDETDSGEATPTSSEGSVQSVPQAPPPPPPPLPPPGAATAPPPPPVAPPAVPTPGGGFKKKKSIKTKYRMPLLNWQDLKCNQVAGTIFSELDDEHVYEEVNMAAFEEQFKTKAQSAPVELGTLKKKLAQKAPSKVSLMEPNRAKNLAITLRKEGVAGSDICCAIETYNPKALSLDFLELLERFIPTEYEMKLIHSYECEGRPLDELSEEDRFMVLFSKIPRLGQRISTLTFMGNFPESVQLMQPQLNAVIAASMSLKSSVKLKKLLEIILAFGNYMNSSKRGAAYGFRLQSLDLLLDTKSTDRKQTLLNFITSIIQEKYPEVRSFYAELHFLDKAALGEQPTDAHVCSGGVHPILSDLSWTFWPVSLDSIQQDVQALERGMELTRREFSIEKDNPVLQTFLSLNTGLLNALTADRRTAQDVYDSVVEYFGENSKTTPPSMFFPVFIRFIKAYKQAEQENEQRKKHELNSEAPSTPPRPDGSETKVLLIPKLQQMDLIAELKRRQVSPLVRERKDGAIEDIITDLKNQPYRRADAARHSAKWKQSQQLQVSSDISL